MSRPLVETQKVEELTIRYRGWGDDINSVVTLTKWGNGEGYSVLLYNGERPQNIELFDGDVDALIAVLSQARLYRNGND
jgi:hypothetical protein